MKKRPETHEKSDASGSRVRPMKKKRLGGKGLSLEAFANAKSNNTHYNPSLIKKQREFYKNAKYVSKYKKSLRHQSIPQDHGQTTERITESGNEVKEGKKMMKNSLQSVREEFEKRRLEEERARREREAIAQAKKEEIKKSEARRRVMREKMLKKTAHGQPVMKYRLEHILQSIQGSTN